MIITAQELKTCDKKSPYPQYELQKQRHLKFPMKVCLEDGLQYLAHEQWGKRGVKSILSTNQNLFQYNFLQRSSKK